MPAPAVAAALDDLLLYRLSRLQAVAGGMVLRLCEGRFGITRREWRLVIALAHRGAMGSSQLADEVQLDRTRTSRAVGTLVAKQLVLRTVDAGDRRQVLLALTPAGTALHAELFPLVAQINRELLETLDGGTAALLLDALRRMQVRADTMAQAADQPKADRRRRRPMLPKR